MHVIRQTLKANCIRQQACQGLVNYRWQSRAVLEYVLQEEFYFLDEEGLPACNRLNT